MLRHSSIRLSIAILLATSMWVYVQCILIPYQQMEARSHDRPRGNLSDLYPRWLGTRELLLHHRDPYSPEVTREIQTGYYGRILEPARSGDPRDQQAFAYPVFVAFLLRPIVSLPFDEVRPVFTWVLVLLTALSVPLWLYFVSWRVSVLDQAAIIVLALGSFQVAQGLKLQQLSLLVGFLIAAASASIKGGKFLTAGAFLALALIKPQLTLPLVAWLAVWTTGDLKKRWQLIAGFSIVAGVLFAGSHTVLPGWIGKFYEAVIAYRQYTGGSQTLLDMLIGRAVGTLLNALLVLTCIVVGWRARREPEESPKFLTVTVLVLSVTVVIVPMVALFTTSLLIPGLLFLFNEFQNFGNPLQIHAATKPVRFLWGMWPWLASVSLLAAAVAVPRETILKMSFLPVYSTPSFPVFVTALLLLNLRTADRESLPISSL
jgi:hypothetical protein